MYIVHPILWNFNVMSTGGLGTLSCVAGNNLEGRNTWGITNCCNQCHFLRSLYCLKLISFWCNYDGINVNNVMLIKQRMIIFKSKICFKISILLLIYYYLSYFKNKTVAWLKRNCFVKNIVFFVNVMCLVYFSSTNNLEFCKG